MRVLIFFAALLALVSYVQAGNWAVIIAGSNTYGNYRHQSDACHAYQIAKKFGIPEEHIILMAYNDIASDPSNPFPGQIFNKPTAQGTPGVDVYAGCKVAYEGGTVTADNFLAVIQGDAKKVPIGYPVLNSTSDDNVFIYYTDHGGVGILGMPNNEPYLYATDLNAALQAMYKAKKFNKLVFYLEACESGSMFEGILPTTINIYATTASSADESSYGTYCAPDDMVNGKEINSCLGDEYSVNWMENSDSAGAMETIADQITIVTQETKMSGVHQYGTDSFTSMPIGAFQGGLNNSSKSAFDALESVFANRASKNAKGSSINSRDVALHIAYTKYQRAQARKAPAAEVQAALLELEAELATRGYADAFFNLLSTTIKADGSLLGASTLPVTNTACQKAVDAAISKCGAWNDYSGKYHNVVVNACMQPEACTATLVNTVESVCAQLPKPANYKF